MKQTGPAPATLEARLDYRFARPELLRQALTHSSIAFETGTSGTGGDNELLEFLGDAVLGMVVAEALFLGFPQLPEGTLTRMRALLVGRKYLSEVGQHLGLGDHLLLGKGEESSGGRRKPVLLANATEAVIAAVYLDGGLEPAQKIVEREIIAPRAAQLAQAAGQGAEFGGVIGDYKSALQELLQSRADGAQPRYSVAEESGPDHLKHFRVALAIERAGAETMTVHGEGSTKKQAQQRAAEEAYKLLREGME